jgi:hypothetical protein
MIKSGLGFGHYTASSSDNLSKIKSYRISGRLVDLLILAKQGENVFFLCTPENAADIDANGAFEGSNSPVSTNSNQAVPPGSWDNIPPA